MRGNFRLLGCCWRVSGIVCAGCFCSLLICVLLAQVGGVFGLLVIRFLILGIDFSVLVVLITSLLLISYQGNHRFMFISRNYGLQLNCLDRLLSLLTLFYLSLVLIDLLYYVRY